MTKEKTARSGPGSWVGPARDSSPPPGGSSRNSSQEISTAARRISPPRPASKPTVLVVDDEPDLLHTVHDLLRMDYEVVTRSNAASALEVLNSDKIIHVIMSDQRMPGMSGVELLREAEAIRPETTRLLFTAYADIRAVIDAINRGHVFRYIGKPWDAQEFQAVVRQAVEHHDLLAEKRRLLAELQETNTRLVEADRLKGAFLEVASHELNTPVAVVLGMLELWKISQGPAASAVERQWVDRLTGAAGRLARTVERMLKLVRNHEFSQALELEPVDLDVLARGAVEQIAPYLESRRQRVEIVVDPAIGLIEAESSKLTDVLVNLLANAVKFTPDGGVIHVTAALEPGSIAHARVSIADQGQGIEPSDLPHLFEPFFTGFDTLRHSSGDYQYGKRGIGLGLSLVKSFVELHGGRALSSSVPGVGSTFSFIIPRSQSAPGGAVDP